jgi:rod shape determining protein RodA
MLVSLPLIWNFGFRDTQKIRVMVFLNPELDKSHTGYQAYLARNAIGAGEFIGRQLENSSQARYSIVPERHTDFIFTVIAERTGFVGCILLISLYAFILFRCFYIASKAQDRYGEYMVAGFSAMIMFHFIENIGMCIGILPITGIPLPFVSYGGTAMIANYAAIGIILSVSVSGYSSGSDPPGDKRKAQSDAAIRQ